MPRCCWSIGRSPAASARCCCPASSSGRVCRRSCAPSSPSRRCCRPARPSTSSSSGWRCTISPIPAAPSISRCCRTGRTPTRRPTRETPTSWRRPLPASSGSTAAIRPPKAAIASSCCTGVASGTRRRDAGWDGSASAASCTSSIACCAARPTRHSSTRERAAAGRRPLRHHPRRRHATAARRDPAPGRQDGAPAQPAASRRHREPGGRRLWRAAAARHAVVAGRRGRLAVPAGLLPQQRHRSLCVGGVRRLPGPVRRGLLLRQGHLRRRCLRGGAARPGARQCDAEPRSLRGRIRPRGPGVRHRGRRGVPRPLRRRRGAPAPLGARRLAAAALDARPREGQPDAGSLQRRHGDRLLEDVRQSAADLVGAGGVRRAAGGLDPAASRRARLDGLRPADGRPADDPAGDRGPCAAACRHHDAQSFFGACVGYRQRGIADRPARGLSAPPGLADGGCDRPDHVPAVRQAPPPARMDHLGPVQQQAR